MIAKRISLITMLILLVFGGSVWAQPYSSSNYSIEESFIGPGGLLDANSEHYNLRASLGDTGVGNSASDAYQIFGGYTTTNEEYLELAVDVATIDMGVITDTITAYGSATFHVRSYLAHGYAITSSGGPPTNEHGDVIDAMSSRAGPTAGQEQFGFNLTTNTLPAVFGEDPDQIPDSTFSFGYALPDYDVTNEYKYVPGEIIAQSDSSSGQTTYTLSYIINREFLTPAGLYTMGHSIIATSTF